MNLGQRNKVSVTGNMSSMTDLVFLLLIFFVILSTLASKGVKVDLPQSQGVISEATRLSLEIAVGEKYSLDGVVIAKEDIESKLQVIMNSREDKTLYLVVDRNVPTGATVEMIGMAKENKWQVLLGSSKIKK
ncbi:MAG: biopolymer transporter ExbD [Flavobacteriales bacterium]|nr:biopolymer transporter ExbD [Flavobacteriales bacterium]